MKRTLAIISSIVITLAYLKINTTNITQDETVFVEIQEDSTELIIPKSNKFDFTCITNEKVTKNLNSKNTLQKSLIPFQEFTINTSRDTSIFLQTGTQIIIPKNAFIDHESHVIKENLRLKFREFHNATSIALAEIPMKVDNKSILISGGMFEIKAFQNNKDVLINSNSSLTIHLVSSEKNNQFNHYYLNPISKKWEDKGDLNFDTSSIAAKITPEIRWWEFTKDFQEKTGYFKKRRENVTIAIREHELKKFRRWAKNPQAESKATFYTLFSKKTAPENAKFRYLSWHLSEKNHSETIKQFLEIHNDKNQAAHSFWRNMSFVKCENEKYQVHFSTGDSNLVLTVVPDNKNYPGYNKFNTRLQKWEEKLLTKYQVKLNKLYIEALQNIKHKVKNMNQKELERFVRLKAIRPKEIDFLIAQRKLNLPPKKMPYKAEITIRSLGIHNIDAPIDYIVYQSGNILKSPIWVLKTGYNAYARATKKKYIKKRRSGYPRIINEPKSNETIDKITLIQQGFNTSFEYTNEQLGKFEYSTYFKNLGIVFLSNGKYKIIPPKEFTKYDSKSAFFNFKGINAGSSDELKKIIKNLGFEI